MKKNIKFNQLVFSFYDKTKETTESLAFESWMFIFDAKDFSLEWKVHHHNFEVGDHTRDIKLPILITKF